MENNLKNNICVYGKVNHLVVHLKHYKSTILLVTPQTIACQAPLSMEFSRQEYWSGLLCPPPGNLPDPGIELGSPLL